MNASDVARVLQGVYDPELGIDIVSLGMVYGIAVRDGSIAVEMALTTAECPLAMTLIEGACRAVDTAFPGQEVSVEVVDEPEWDVRMASRDALRMFGLAAAV